MVVMINAKLKMDIIVFILLMEKINAMRSVVMELCLDFSHVMMET